MRTYALKKVARYIGDSVYSAEDTGRVCETPEIQLGKYLLCRVALGSDLKLCQAVLQAIALEVNDCKRLEDVCEWYEKFNLVTNPNEL